MPFLLIWKIQPFLWVAILFCSPLILQWILIPHPVLSILSRTGHSLQHTPRNKYAMRWTQITNKHTSDMMFLSIIYSFILQDHTISIHLFHRLFLLRWSRTALRTLPKTNFTGIFTLENTIPWIIHWFSHKVYTQKKEKTRSLYHLKCFS